VEGILIAKTVLAAMAAKDIIITNIHQD